MRRRPPPDVPAILAVFDLEDWPAEGANHFERYCAAAGRWRVARDEWAQRAGWEGDRWWWAQSMYVSAETPDEPWCPGAD